jgi:hypothetical protein
MKKQLLSLLAALLSFISIHSQTNNPCGTAPAPAYLLNEMFNADRSIATFTVPVVFHVYYDYSTLWLPAGYEDVKGALDSLNMRFAKQNPDTAVIYSGFKSIASDAQIRFELARKDENGNCISGVMYHYVSNPFSHPLATNLNTNKYMNVHVVAYSGLNAGFAYYPTLWSATPDPGNHIVIVAPYLKSDVMTHEAGHWLSLIHTFGNVNQTGTCGDDQVADTPITPGGPTCDTLQSTCNPPIIENVNNYMDYSPCGAMFTQGQTSRMQATLLDQTLSRREISTPANHAFTGINPPPSSCTFTCSPIVYADYTANCTFTPYYRFIANAFAVSPDSIKWTFPNGVPASSTSSVVKVKFSSSSTVTLKAWYLGVQYTYTLTVNPSLTTSTGLTSISTIPYTQNFENNFSLPHNTLFVTTADTTWKIASLGYFSDSSLYIPAEHKLQSDTNKFTFGTFNLSGLLHPQLSFKVATSHNSNTVYRKLFIYLRNRCTGTERLVTIQYDSVMAGTNTATGFTPTLNSQWKNINVNLAFVSSDSLRKEYEFRFELVKYFSGSKVDEKIYIDDLNISEITVGSPPVAAFSIEKINFCYAGCYQLECVDQSTGSPFAYSWGTFGGYPNNPVAKGCYFLFPSDTVLIYLTVWNQYGSSTATMPVYIHTIFSDSITVSPFPACAGDTLTMQFHSSHDAPNGETYLWTNNATPSAPYTTLLDSAGATVQVIPAANASYNIAVQNAYGCSASFTKAFTTYPQPFAYLTQSGTCIAVGDSVTLTAAYGGGYTYSWQPPAGLNTTAGNVVVASPATSTFYTVTVSDANCSNTGQIEVKVSPNYPVSQIVTNDSIICPGETTTLHVNSNVPVTNTWSWNPCCTGTYTIYADSLNCGFNITTTVTLNSTDANGCQAADTMVLTQSGYPTFWVHPYSSAYNSGSQIILCSNTDSVCLSAQGAAPYTYIWNNPSGFVNYTNVNNQYATIHLPNFMLTYFTVTAITQGGCQTNQQFMINHQYQGNYPAMTLNPSSISLCQNASANVYLTPSTSNYYYWMPQTGLTNINPLPIGPGNVGNGSYATVTGTTIQTYTVTAIEVNYGCVRSKVLTVNLSPAPPVSLGADTTICNGDTLTLDAQNPGLTYLWNTGAVTQTIDLNAGGNYQVAVTGANGCIGYDTISVSAVACLDSPEENSSASTLNLYFAESPDAYFISCENGKEFIVSLVDLTGRTVFTEKNSGGMYSLSKTKFSAGIYLMAVDVEGKRVVRKIVLR